MSPSDPYPPANYHPETNTDPKMKTQKTTAFNRLTLRASPADARFLTSKAKRPGATVEGTVAEIFAAGVAALKAGKVSAK
jgi:hypothetical protein